MGAGAPALPDCTGDSTGGIPGRQNALSLTSLEIVIRGLAHIGGATCDATLPAAVAEILGVVPAEAERLMITAEQA